MEVQEMNANDLKALQAPSNLEKQLVNGGTGTQRNRPPCTSSQSKKKLQMEVKELNAIDLQALQAPANLKNN